MKNAIIVHGWGGAPEKAWFPWLKREFEKRLYQVEIPKMPNPNLIKMEEWLGVLKQKQIGNQTYLVGHSLGCQTILRYLEKSSSEVDTVILVAPWLGIQKLSEEEMRLARPWVANKIDIEAAKTKAKRFILVTSTNDPYPIPLEIDILEKVLNAQRINLGAKGHINEESNVLFIREILPYIEMG
jgi:uncharacterized protein